MPDIFKGLKSAEEDVFSGLESAESVEEGAPEKTGEAARAAVGASVKTPERIGRTLERVNKMAADAAQKAQSFSSEFIPDVDPDKLKAETARAAGAVSGEMKDLYDTMRLKDIVGKAREKRDFLGRMASRGIGAVKDFDESLEFSPLTKAVAEAGIVAGTKATKDQLTKLVGPSAARALSDVSSGAVATVGGFGGLARKEGLESIGSGISKTAELISGEFQPQDPNLADAIAQGFGSMATFMVPGFGIQAGAGRLALFAPRMAQYLGVSTAAVLEASVEAGSTYNSFLRKFPGQKDDANQAANKVFWRNLPVLLVTDRFGVMAEGGPVAARAFSSALMEGSQEASQEVVSNIALYDDTLQGTLTAFAVGAVVGGTVGGAGAVIEGAGKPEPPEVLGTDRLLTLKESSVLEKRETDLPSEEFTPPTPPEGPPEEPPVAGDLPEEAKPIASPGARWTVDPGAIPGEPVAWIDSESKEDSPAAIIELDKGGYEGRLAGGTPIYNPETGTGVFEGPEAVARQVEEMVDAGMVRTRQVVDQAYRGVRFEVGDDALGPGVEATPEAIKNEIEGREKEARDLWNRASELEKATLEKGKKGDLSDIQKTVQAIGALDEFYQAFEDDFGSEAVEILRHRIEGKPIFLVSEEELPFGRAPKSPNPLKPKERLDVGQRVTLKNGDTGKIRSIDDGEADIEMDIAKAPGGVPIIELRTVPLEDIETTKEPLRETEKPPKLEEEAPRGPRETEEPETEEPGSGVEEPGEPRPPEVRTPEGEQPGDAQEPEAPGETQGAPVPGRGKKPRSGGEGVPEAPIEGGEPGPGGEGGPRRGPQRVDSSPRGANHRILASDGIGTGTPVQKFKKNIDAIRLLKDIEKTGRLANREEQKALAQYVGWGGIDEAFSPYGDGKWPERYSELKDLLSDDEYIAARASTPNAHYTSFEVVEALWRMAEKMGFKGGRVLEPSMGIGNFFGIMPESLRKASRLTGIELDGISARISKQLYQSANIIHSGFERAKIADGFFDFIISNVPFGNYGVADRSLAKTGMTQAIHNYFFAKALEKVRPGGVVMFITSSFTMDGKKWKSARDYISERSDLVAAVRLPSDTFTGNAGTKVVTDVLVLRKKDGTDFKGKTWSDTVEKRDKKTGERYLINEYYEANPGHLLGKGEMANHMNGRAWVLKSTQPIDQALSGVLKDIPEGVFSEPARPEVEPTEIIPAPDSLKEGNLDVVGGKVFRRKGSELVPVETSGIERRRIAGLVKLRKSAQDVLRTQLAGEDDKAIGESQNKLKKAYSDFVKKFGSTWDRANARAMRGDPDYPLLRALEERDTETGKQKRADIFTKKVIEPFRKVESVDTSLDALLASFNESGKIDLAYMSRISNKTEDELVSELQGRIFNDPESGWVPAEQYLSGNVRKKLALAEEAAKTEQDFQINVEALKAVQPKELKPGEIFVRLGAPWIPEADVSDFAKSLMELHPGISGFEIRYIPTTSSWVVDISGSARAALRGSPENWETWGTPRYPAINMIRDALNGKVPTVYDRDGKTSSVNQKATAAARFKQEKIIREFEAWLFKDQERRARLVKYYNEVFNNYRRAQFDGSHLELRGSNPSIKLRPVQKDGVWRVVSSPFNTLLAWEVGVGKTYAGVAALMEMRRMGIRKKPMIVAPRHLMAQWSRAFTDLYPGAKILPTTEKDFSPGGRAELMSRIATGDWDAVIVPEKSFQKLPMSAKFMEDIFREQINELEAALKEAYQNGERSSLTVKQLEKAKKRLEAKLRELQDEESKDATVTFEELGVDHLFVDESQAFKNLFYSTGMQVAGLGNQKGSLRAFDMYAKTKYINDLHGGGHITFATGTPISNTIAEMFHLQRYLQPEILKESGLFNFDAWAATFGEKVTKIELAVEGGTKFVQKTRFARFVNLQELMTRYHQVADVRLAEDLPEIKRPKIKGGKPDILPVPSSEELADYITDLGKRAEDIRARKVQPDEDNMLLVSTDGRKAALDMRLVDPSSPDLEGSKVNIAVSGIFDAWKEGKKGRWTQVVFLDLGTPPAKGKKSTGINLYEDIRSKLVRMGIPKNEIAFIHEYPKDEQKAVLFDRMNRGSVRVLLGSTEKMGTGMNVQNRLKDLWHLDAPWRPDQVEQREGRILRQGNMHDEVRIHRMVSEGSFDRTIWQILSNKATFVRQLMASKIAGRSMEDADKVVLSYEEVKAIASGDPRIIQKVETDSEIAKLEALESEHRNSVFRMQDDIGKIPHQIASQEKILGLLKEDIKKIEDIRDRAPEGVFKGRKFEKRESLGKMIEAERKRLSEALRTNPEEVGTYKGLPLFIRATKVLPEVQVKLGLLYTGKIGQDPLGTVRSLDHAIDPETLKKRVSGVESEIKTMKGNLDRLKVEVEKPFELSGQLEDLRKKKAEIDESLGLTKDEAGGAISDDPGAESEVAHDFAPSMRAEDYGGIPSTRGQEEAPPSPFNSTFPVELGGMDLVKPVQMPEMVKLVEELTGERPKIKSLPKSRGLFKGGPLGAQIVLNPEIFQDPFEAATVLAHEIGHLIDYLDAGTLKRGNLLGRMKSLQSFLKNTFGTDSVTNKRLREELIAVSEWWRPYNKESAPPSFIAYRNSSAELYADAISVLLNSPGTLERMAPNFYEGFFDNLEKKPKAHEAWMDLQDFLTGGEEAVVEQRQKDLLEMFKRGDLKSAELAKEAASKRKLLVSDVFEQLRFYFQNKFFKIVDALNAKERAGEVVDPEFDPRNIIEENDMYMLDVQDFLDRFQENVFGPLFAEGFILDHLDQMLFNDRIFGDRSGLANPAGHNRESAGQALALLEKQLGAEKFRKLRDIAQKFHRMIEPYVREAVRIGVYNKKVFEEKIEPNLDYYSTFQVLKHMKDWVSPQVQKMIGTFEDVNRPSIPTILKTIGLIRLNNFQRARQSFIDTWIDEFPGEIEKARPLNPGEGRPIFRNKPDRGILEHLDDGHVVGYYVDPFIAEAFKKDNEWSLDAVTRIVRASTQGIFYPLWITYNLGFSVLFNPIRDNYRTYTMLHSQYGGKKITLAGVIWNFLKTLPEAWRSAQGIDSDFIKKLKKIKALNVNYENFSLGQDHDQLDSVIRKYHGRLLRKGTDEAVSFVRKFLNVIKNIAVTTETAGKVAGARARYQFGERGKKFAWNVRNRTGTPNYKVKGKATKYSNAWFPFSNIAIQGYVQELEVLRDPKTRGGYAWARAKINVLPTLLKFAAAAGLFGEALKAWFERMSEYDKTNYNLIPLGAESLETGKVFFGPGAAERAAAMGPWKAVGIRIPTDEGGRFIQAILWKILNGMRTNDFSALSQVLDFTAGQIPGLAPLPAIMATWTDVMRGRNPRDSFRGRDIIDQTSFKAGMMPRAKKTIEWTINQLGIVRFVTFDASHGTWTEAIMRATPLLNRMVRITDYGLQEKARREISEDEQVAAQFRLGRDPEIKDFLMEWSKYNRMRRAEALSPEGEKYFKRLNGFKTGVLQKVEKRIKRNMEAGNEKAVKRDREFLKSRINGMSWRRRTF